MSKYSKSFKAEALRLSDEIGVKKAAAQLGIPYYTLADWRQERSIKKQDPTTMSDDELRRRNTELECENAEQAKLCISENATTAQSQADYERKYSAISSRYEQAEQRLKKLMNETEQRHVRKTRLIAFIHDLGEQSFVLGEWSEEAWVRMVESVTVERSGRMVFRFKDGSEVVYCCLMQKHSDISYSLFRMNLLINMIENPLLKNSSEIAVSIQIASVNPC